MISHTLLLARAHEDIVEVDLKEGVKKKLEDMSEAHPALRKTLGFALQTVIPSDVELCDIDAVRVDDKGNLRLVISRHVDIILPLEVDEARKLEEKLNELIPLSKTKKRAKRKRLPLHSWWPDYYSYVISAGSR